MRKFLFKSHFSLGDTVLLTAAVRDLHKTFPRAFAMDVRTGFAELWANNPYLTPLDDYDPAVSVVQCEMPLVDRSHESACHCLHGFVDFFNRYLGTSIKPTQFKGDLHLTRSEKTRRSQVHELVGADVPFWIISAGGKLDYTIKLWEAARYQEVVDHFRGRIQFIQVGDAAHFHPKLKGVIDLRGKTTVRELVRLVYHAQGAVCGVTGLMHLAAAVPVRPGRHHTRPCVVVAGGRESPHWEAYPGHQFIHTVGALSCCATGGCWRARALPLGDGDEMDKNLCVDVRGVLPRCMDMISSAEVVRRIETFFDGGVANYLSATQAKTVARGVTATAHHDFPDAPLNHVTALEAAESFRKRIPPYPGDFQGRGIVICGGGVLMFTNAWVCINMLRRLGCVLPIQLWHLGDEEMDDTMRALVTPLGVECVDAFAVRREHPVRRLNGWALKPYALVHSPFEEVMLLDADNVPVVNPEFLFETPQFRRSGAIFWPDHGRLGPQHSAWKIFSVPYRDEPEFESGQMVVNKRKCWEPLALCLWYNENCDFFYQHVHGDKETFHMAFRKCKKSWSMPGKPIQSLPGTMCQHDFQGRRLFQHRNLDKWNLFFTNQRVRGFQFEGECRESLRRLKQSWDCRISRHPSVITVQSLSGPAASRACMAPQDVKISAFMVSCAQRDALRQRTLAKLAATDWGDEPVRVQIDERRFRGRLESAAHTAWLALRESLKTDADYFLYLEDDLEFNRYFRQNLHSWPVLRRRQVYLASLYNPGIRELAWDVPNNAILIEPQFLYGAQALLMARTAAQYFLDHWFEAPTPVDLKFGHLTGRQQTAMHYHCPSLVQHIGKKSAWGGRFHQASDFNPRWLAPAVPPLEDER
ncbi:MAG: hypothetical protein HY043_21625 [Verrucomicrobia bacterium]|nr:hypothetical protein [Verrucomicrobiota bacterium]